MQIFPLLSKTKFSPILFLRAYLVGVDPFLAVLDDDGAVGDVVGPSKVEENS